MAAAAVIQEQGNKIRISVELTLQPGTSMLDYEEQILEALNEVGAVASGKCLERFDTDGSPIVLRVADGAFPGAVEAAQLYQQSAAAAGIPLEIKREPNDGYWSDVWNVQPFCASYWGGRPVQDQMYSTAYLSTADWNDTRFNNPHFDELLLSARAELDLLDTAELDLDPQERILAP